MVGLFAEVCRRRGLKVNAGSLVNARDLQLECTRILHETFLVSVLMHDSETLFWKEKERSRIRLYRWTTSDDFLVSGRWIESRMHG